MGSASVAHWIERPSTEREVVGSNPTRRTRVHSGATSTGSPNGGNEVGIGCQPFARIPLSW